MSEADLQAAVLDLAARLGYLRAHFRPAQVRPGRWATPQTGDPGYPDLTLVGNGRVVFAELKGEKGRFEAGQTDWRDAILRAGGEWHLWKPRDWMSGAIEATLRGPGTHDATVGRLVRSAA